MLPPAPRPQPSAASNQALRKLEEELAQERLRVAQLQQELQHLVKVRLPAVLAGVEVPAAEHPDELTPETQARLEEILSQVGGALTEREESRRLALVELASRVQTSAHRIQQAMSGLAERHPGDPDLLETSMRVDHAATQQARHAQSVKVLCDEWPGQQWPAPLALVDVARAASGRIVAFGRVQVTGDQTVAVVPSVVEPLIHLVAELLANATEYSAPTSPVTVAVRGVQRGAVIEVDDSGFGLDDYRLAEAREIVSGRRLLGVSDVGEIPQTGFAVVGRFARRHGLTVDLGMSPYGGVRAVVLVPTRQVVTVALPAPPAPPAPDLVTEPRPVIDTRPRLDPHPVTDTRTVGETPSADEVDPVAEGRSADEGRPSGPGSVETEEHPVTHERPQSDPRLLSEARRSTAPQPTVAPESAEIQLPQRRSARRRDQTAPFRTDSEALPRPVAPTAPDTAPEEAGEWMERYFEGSQPLPVTPTTNESDSAGDPSPATARKDDGQA